MYENNIAEKWMIIIHVLGVIIRPIDVPKNWTIHGWQYGHWTCVTLRTSVVDVNREGMCDKNDCWGGILLGHPLVDIDQECMYVKNDCLLCEVLGHPSAYGRTLFWIYVHIGRWYQSRRYVCKNDCFMGEFLGHPSAYGRTFFRIYVQDAPTSMCDKGL